jgi:hypothetical protein
MAYSGILKVTDGITSVSFLAQSSGIILQENKPGTHQAKGGAIWASSQFGDGRQMVMRSWDNQIETYDVNITGADMDGSIGQFRKLLNLLVLAGAYWMSNYQIGSGTYSSPIWLEARGDCETETRYAYIYDGTIPSLSNPYAEPFRNSGSTTETIPVIIEHGVWRDQPPGDTSCLKVASYREDNGADAITFYPAQNSDTVYVVNATNTLTTNALYNLAASGLGADKHDTGIRFTNVTIPKNAIIRTAFIKWTSNYSSAPGEIEAAFSTIKGELSADAPTYTTWANWNARALTVASASVLDWSQPIVAGEVIYLSELKYIVQAIVAQAGWVSGNAMAFRITSPATANDLNRIFAAFSDPTYDMPELHISYEVTDHVYGVYLPLCINNYAAGYDVDSHVEEVRFWSAAGAFWSPNLLYSYDPTQPLFHQFMGVGDLLVFGSSFPFSNIHLNLSSFGDGTVTYQYKYSTAASINTTLINNPVEYPAKFFSAAVPGPMQIVLSRLNSWAKFTAGWAGATPMYFVAVQITNIAVAPTVNPSQVDEQIYTVNWPYWDIDENEINGDIDALIKFLVVQITSKDFAGAEQGYNHFLFGLRTFARGEYFTPYLGVDGLRTGISFAATAPATIQSSGLSPSGKYLSYNVGGATAKATIGTWSFTTPSLLSQYYGKFRAFVRGFTFVGLAGACGLTLKVVEMPSGNVLSETTPSYNNLTATGGYDYELIDLGFIDISSPGGLLRSQIDLVLTCETLNIFHLYVYELILMPVDEGNIEIDASGDLALIGKTYPGYHLYHDSTLPKDGPHSAVVDNNTVMIYDAETNVLDKFTIPSQKRMRLYFLPFKDGYGLKGTEGIFDWQSQKVQQYLNMRGDA